MQERERCARERDRDERVREMRDRHARERDMRARARGREREMREMRARERDERTHSNDVYLQVCDKFCIYFYRRTKKSDKTSNFAFNSIVTPIRMGMRLDGINFNTLAKNLRQQLIFDCALKHTQKARTH